MDVVDYLLEGLEAELTLERELGVRTVEVDRSLLEIPVDTKADAQPPRPNTANSSTTRHVDRASSPCLMEDSSSQLPGRGRPGHGQTALGLATSSPKPSQSPQPSQPSQPSLVFLHDRALSPKGVEMMAKIITALGYTAETAPVIVVPPAPRARVTVVLGALALKKYYQNLRGGPGQWLKTESGDDVLVTYSPEYILRFGTVTPALTKLKQEMWLSLKAAKQRLVG